MPKKFKLLHVITSLQRGGAETFLVDLIDALGPYGYEHHIIYFYPGPFVEELERRGHATYQIKGILCPYDPWFLISLVYRIFKIKPTMMHSHLWSANALSSLIGYCLRVPVVCTLHSPLRSEDGTIRYWIDRITLPFATKICSVSTSVARSWQQKFTMISSEKWITIPNGVWPVARVVDHERTADRPFTIGTVGRFISSKRFDLLIDAFALVHAMHSDTRLMIVGFGQEEGILRDRVARHGLQDAVTFVVGHVARDYYHLMDCFVLPSEREGMSIALLEAMATGVPVIVRTDGQAHDVITDGQNGLVLITGDPQELADRITQLYADRDFTKKLAESGQQTIAERYHISVAARAYQGVYEVVSKKHNERK